jgi:hypothetical protein
MMTTNARRKTGQRKQRRYGLWSLGAILVIAVLVIGVIAVRSLGEEPYLTPAASAYLPEITRVSASEVKAKLDKGATIAIVDTRTVEEYQQRRIVGAISIPFEDISWREGELRGYWEIFTYCE